MIRHDLLDKMDLLKPVEMNFLAKRTELNLYATFPEEFRYLTEPPLPVGKVRLTFHEQAEDAIANMRISFEANLGVPSNKSIDFFGEHGHIEPTGHAYSYLTLQHYQVELVIPDGGGQLRVSITVPLVSVAKANAPSFIEKMFKHVVWEFGDYDNDDAVGYQNFVNVTFVPEILEVQRREDDWDEWVEMRFEVFDFNERLVLKKKVSGQSIYTFRTADEPVFDVDELPEYPTPEFVDFINDDFPGPPLLNVTLNDDVLSMDWDICSVKIYRSLGRIEVIIFGEPRESFPPFPKPEMVREALEVANAWDRDMYAASVELVKDLNKEYQITSRERIPDEAKVQCRYTKYRPVYEKRRQTANGVQVLKGGCINDDDPIDLDEFEEDQMVFQTTDGICYKSDYTREILRNEMAYEDARIRGQILSSNCFEKVERDESAFMRMSLLGLN